MKFNSVCNHTSSDYGPPHSGSPICLITSMISNGNRTEWSPIRSVIIRVINKIGRPRSGSLISLITSKITGRIELDDTKFCYKIFDI